LGRPGVQDEFNGRGLGLELDEMPVIKYFGTPLYPDQTVASGPKFVFAGHGMAGIEHHSVAGPCGGGCLTPLSSYLIVL
jgi:hypothetical protein